MTARTVVAYTATQTAPSTSANGRTMSSMEKVWRHGLMEPNTKVTILMAKRLVKDILHGLMVVFSMENLLTMILMATASTPGVTAASFKVTGRTTRCMAMACSIGLMVGNMKGPT